MFGIVVRSLGVCIGGLVRQELLRLILDREESTRVGEERCLQRKAVEYLVKHLWRRIALCVVIEW